MYKKNLRARLRSQRQDFFGLVFCSLKRFWMHIFSCRRYLFFFLIIRSQISSTISSLFPATQKASLSSFRAKPLATQRLLIKQVFSVQRQKNSSVFLFGTSLLQSLVQCHSSLRWILTLHFFLIQRIYRRWKRSILYRQALKHLIFLQHHHPKHPLLLWFL